MVTSALASQAGAAATVAGDAGTRVCIDWSDCWAEATFDDEHEDARDYVLAMDFDMDKTPAGECK